MYFEDVGVIDYLLENDSEFLKVVIAHNEKRAEFCGP